MVAIKPKFTVTRVPEDVNISVSLGSASGSDNTPQVLAESTSHVAVGVEGPLNNDGAQLVSTAEPAEDAPPGDTETPASTTFCTLYGNWAEKAAESWLMLGMLTPVLCGSFFFIYMGSRYYHQCPFYPSFPLMTVVMGAAISFAVMIRILRISKVLEGHPRLWFLRYLKTCGVILFFLLFVVQMGLYMFSEGYPSWFPDEPNYCNLQFYKFLDRSFISVILGMLLTGIVYAPLVHRFFYPLE